MFIEKSTNAREAQKAETRTRLLDVARAHFERAGYEGASFRAIAKDAGVAVGTVALHFGDKRGLLHAALFDDLEEAIALCLAQGGSGTLVDQLAAVMAPAYASYARRPALSRTLLESALFASSPWRERYAGQAMRVHAHVAGLVAQAKARGEIDRGVDVNLFASAAFTFYYMALIGWAQGQVDAPLGLFRSLLEQHVRGALPRA